VSARRGRREGEERVDSPAKPCSVESDMDRTDLETLLGLLRRRLETVGDAALRERDPAGQLALLREVSEAIAAFHERHRSALPPRLRHFLENASLDKARDWVEAELARG